MRKTKIICTIGPASESEDKLHDLIMAGMNVARFNFSHGSHEEHEAKFLRLRKIRIGMNLPIATLLDTKGPEIRLRDFENHSVMLERGQKFTLTTDEVVGDEKHVSITYKDLPGDVRKGTHILIDDGLIGLVVDDVTATDIVCTVENGGKISDKKGVNVPDAELSMPFISDQDRSDIEFGCQLGFDYIACSFTRTADDIREVRKILDAHDSKMKVIAKIESTQGINNIDEILDVVDGVMVARGDLGVEVPLEDVPIYQKQIITKAQKKAKIVITATQMLDSMIHNPRPTRAETADVANAIYDGTTAIMLSGETAAGAYPVEAVQTMARIAERAEKEIDYSARRHELLLHDGVKHTETTAICHASASISEEIHAKAIIAVTISGYTATRLSRLRPTVPIIACTTNSRVACQMNLLFGVVPLIIGMEENADALFEAAIQQSKHTGLISDGDIVIITAGVPLGKSGTTNLIKVVTVD